ncbi:MAG: riboflavin biosynthesis protein RibF [Deinococcales bacterium]
MARAKVDLTETAKAAVYESLLDEGILGTFSGSILCLGTFDGVHLGHDMLLRHLQASSEESALPAIIISFHPPVRSVFQGVRYLSSRDEKLMLLSRYQPHAIVMIPFSFDYAKTEKGIFLAQLAQLNPKRIIVGDDFRFGHQREGGVADLRTISDEVDCFGMRRLNGMEIKSSYIRMLIQEAQIDEAARFLGRSYFACGKVIHGEERGHSIGFPTANVALPEQKLLPQGVFAVMVECSYGSFAAMANVGPRPSFPEAPPALEVHIFDFNQDLYGQEIIVHFKHYLRSQIKFASLTELKAQLAEDGRMALSLLKSPQA